MAQGGTIKVDGREISIGNLDKVLYPGNGFIKEQVIEFYIRVSRFILPHLKDRPVTLKRYPDGVRGEAFWEKDAPGFAPKWVKTFPVPRKLERGVIHYILINDLSTLAWCASIATIELHPFLHCVPAIDQPTAVVFDLDPGEGADILACCEVALRLREALAKERLELFPKVSGSKGIQLWLPLNTPVDYEQTKAFARAVAESLHEQFPDQIVADMSKALRVGKVFIDWSQNIQSKTTVGVYSLRAKRAVPFVSMPVEWAELKTALRKGVSKGLYFTPEQALKRLEQLGDLYLPVLKRKQQLPARFHHRMAPKRPRSTKALEAYEAKRDFTKTAEPAPMPRRSLQGGKRRFVIQKHAASHLHYDLRLEMADTLKSWAVPKGLPIAVNDRRSAFAVEDHPMEYLTFEGVIPEGQYGGGTVMVWDIGTYEVVDGNYWKGRLHLYLAGSKLKGEWTLERVQDGDKPRWVITKTGRSLRLRSSDEDRSAISKRTISEIAQQKLAVWQSHRSATMGRTAKPEFIEPMLAMKVHQLPKGANWMYEWKWDGFRAIAVKEGARVRLYSRRGRDQTASFTGVADALKTVHAERAVLDGEIIAISEKGEVSFQHLQNRGTLPEGWHIVFCAFDVLNVEGEDLRQWPLEQRRQKLEGIVERSGALLSVALSGTPKKLLALGRKAKREGIIAKRRGSVYQSGSRSDAWQKLQLKPHQEFVIGGFRPGGRFNLELLLVGYYENRRLLYAGKVRNALNRFNRKTLFDLLNPLKRKQCPFDNLPNSHRDHFGESVTAEEMNDYTWVKPEVVAQVKFSEWTRGGVLRHAEFQGLREDKAPGEIRREP